MQSSSLQSRKKRTRNLQQTQAARRLEQARVRRKFEASKKRHLIKTTQVTRKIRASKPKKVRTKAPAMTQEKMPHELRVRGVTAFEDCGTRFLSMQGRS